MKQRKKTVPASRETIEALGKAPYRIKVGHIAINPKELALKYARDKAMILRSMSEMNPKEREDFIAQGPIDFVQNKEGKHKYHIFCRNCGAEQGYLWADDEQLRGWCDFHTVTKLTRSGWSGCLTVNVSPVDGILGIECTCGEDTREFRVNRRIPTLLKERMTEYALKHRMFGHNTSSFTALKNKKDVAKIKPLKE